jgi:uncharacterized protein (DUF362 family)
MRCRSFLATFATEFDDAELVNPDVTSLNRGEKAMNATHPHEIYSRDATVHLVSGKDKVETFRRTVEQAGFVPHLLERWQASGKAKEEFLVAIKPNIMTASIYEEDSPVYTDPALVEELIAIMRGEGFSRFVVVESQNVYNYSFRGRCVPEVADLCGYSGEGYDIVDLTEDNVEFDYGGVLGKHTAGRPWLQADYRISFAKNKSHWQCYYTACLKNVYGCLPEWDKMKHYHGRDIEVFQATVLIADKIPVHFAFLDAWTSGDGLAGHIRDARPNQTCTFLASENAFALDWVAGEKMGVNPAGNCVMADALRRWGPIEITRVGDMAPWHPWANVRPFVVSLANFFEESYWLSRIGSRTFSASQQDERFPPVSRWQRLFAVAEPFSWLLERLGTQKPARERPGARTFPMASAAIDRPARDHR